MKLTAPWRRRWGLNPRAVADLSHFECDPFTTWVLLQILLTCKTASDRTRIEQLKNQSLFELRGFGKPYKIKVFGYMVSTLPNTFRVRCVMTTSLLLQCKIFNVFFGKIPLRVRYSLLRGLPPSLLLYGSRVFHSARLTQIRLLHPWDRWRHRSGV